MTALHVETSARPSGNGSFYVYLVDESDRKIAAVWGPSDSRMSTAKLLAAAPDLKDALVGYMKAATGMLAAVEAGENIHSALNSFQVATLAAHAAVVCSE